MNKFKITKSSAIVIILLSAVVIVNCIKIKSIEQQLTVAEQQLQNYKQSEILNKQTKYNQGISLVEMVYILNSLDQNNTNYLNIINMLNRDSIIEGDIHQEKFNIQYSIQGEENAFIELEFIDKELNSAKLVVTNESNTIEEPLSEELIKNLIESASKNLENNYIQRYIVQNNT